MNCSRFFVICIDGYYCVLAVKIGQKGEWEMVAAKETNKLTTEERLIRFINVLRGSNGAYAVLHHNETVTLGGAKYIVSVKAERLP